MYKNEHSTCLSDKAVTFS